MLLLITVPYFFGEALLIHNRHAVAVAEESVAFANGFLVGAECVFVAGHGADEHEESRTGEVEVREEGAGMFKLVGRADKNAGASIVRQDRAKRLGFEHAGGGRSDGKDALGGVDGVSGIGADRVNFLMHRVLADVFGFHR